MGLGIIAPRTVVLLVIICSVSVASLRVERRTAARRNAELCPRLVSSRPSDHRDVKAAFGIHLDALPEGASVRICEDRAFPHAGVMLIEGFLNTSETAMLQNSVERLRDPSIRRKMSIHRLLPPSFSAEAGDFERRLASFSGVPSLNRTCGPGILQVKVSTDSKRSGELHLDVGYEREVVPWVTALMYLKRPEEGGHTLFPLLDPPKAATTSRAQLLRNLQTEIDTAKQLRGDDLEARPWGVRYRSNATDQMCADLATADRDGTPYPHFGVSPAPGSLLLFWHALPKGLDETYYHQGCSFRGTKSAVQSFREPSRSWYPVTTPAGLSNIPGKIPCSEH